MRTHVLAELLIAHITEGSLGLLNLAKFLPDVKMVPETLGEDEKTEYDGDVSMKIPFVVI